MASSVPTSKGVYDLDLRAVGHLIDYTNEVPGRAESIRRARREGKVLPPVRLAVERNGRLSVDDGNHRLRVAIEEGDRTIRAYVFPTGGTRLPRKSRRK